MACHGTPSTFAALAADLTTVAAPLVYTCVVAGVDALPLGPFGNGLGHKLDLLLPDGGAVEGLTVDDDCSGVFITADAELRVVRLTGFDR